jgi:hypothetical protein
MELASTHQAQRLEDPITTEELTERARAHAGNFRDHHGVVLGETRMTDDGTWRYNGETGRLTPHALAQLCARLPLPTGGTVPASYVTRCPGPLAAQNLNHWLSQPERETVHVLVRTQADTACGVTAVRAVLSSRYTTADHLPLLQLLQTMVRGDHLTVQGWSLDDELWTLRLLVNDDHPASLSDPLRIGLSIRISEIGRGRISINGLVTRLVCGNGLVVNVADLGGIQRRHIDRKGETLSILIHQGLTRVLQEADEAAWRPARLRSQPAPPPVAAFLQRPAQQADLPEALVSAAIALLEGETVYDTINAVTLVAQRLPVADRLKVETAISRFLRHDANGN